MAEDVEEQEPREITFLASFPPIQSAIKSGRDGMRIQLDIPLVELPKAVGLLALQESVLRITVRVEKSRRFGTTEIDRGAAPSPSDLALG